MAGRAALAGKKTMTKRKPPLPPSGSSIAMVTYRFEEITCRIHATVERKKAAAPEEYRLSAPLEAYAHFRSRAFELLSYYVDNGFQAAFRHLLEMHGERPRRSRGSVRGNDFYLGLLAMTAAAGQFMHRNKLRDLAALMQRAHIEGIAPAEFDEFVPRARKTALNDRVVVTSERGRAIRQSSMTPAAIA
jgi:hypothetical protein